MKTTLQNTKFPKTNQYFRVVYTRYPDHIDGCYLFKCTASDESTVVGVVLGEKSEFLSGGNHILNRRDCEFLPVSKAVIKAVLLKK